MSEKHGPTPKFEFDPAFADCIAHVANSWATLEYYVNDVIWAIAGVSPAIGACITAQIFTLQGRLSALLALMKFRKANEGLIKAVNKFAEEVRGPQEMRNRIVHDMWLVDNINKKNMGKMQTTAQKKLVFVVESVEIDKLRSEVEAIHECRTRFEELRREIKAALPSLPRIPPSELHPIVETP